MKFEQARRAMVETQLQARGIQKRPLLQAMLCVPRESFVPISSQHEAYADHPIVLGTQQTVSQPYIVALMIEAAQLPTKARVLDVGTGSGYSAVVLAEMGHEVFTIECVPELARTARDRLHRLGYTQIQTREGDGALGWPEAAPFDAILVAAAAAEVPKGLVQQLADGGHLVLPLGTDKQVLWRISRQGKRLHQQKICPVRFVPLVPVQISESLQASGDTPRVKT